MSNTYESGYDVPVGGGGNYLTLSSKGQKERLRLLFTPIVFTEKFADAKFDSSEAKRAAWVALRRTVVDGKASFEAVTFKASAMVYKGVVALVRSDEWGNPSGYDVVIERTEEKGRYYTVTPTRPKDLTDEEKAAIEEFIGGDIEDFGGRNAGVDAFLESRYLKRQEKESAPADEYDPFEGE